MSKAYQNDSERQNDVFRTIELKSLMELLVTNNIVHKKHIAFNEKRFLEVEKEYMDLRQKLDMNPRTD